MQNTNRADENYFWRDATIGLNALGCGAKHLGDSWLCFKREKQGAADCPEIFGEYQSCQKDKQVRFVDVNSGIQTKSAQI